MAWEGYFCLGGTEIINNARAIEYARTSTCPVNWIIDDPCSGIYDMLDGEDASPPYNAIDIPRDAPWYDTGQFEAGPSQDFLGVYCIDVYNLVDSTVEAESQQRILAGSVIGNQREASRVVRFRVMLTGLSAAALDFGLDWLKSRLKESNCATHAGGGCGTSDLTYFVECREPRSGVGTWSEYNDLVDASTRRLHGVKCISGPIVQEKWDRDGGWGYIVEFTLEAQSPQPYSLPRRVTVSDSGVGGVQDVPINLVEYPSAELSSGTLVIARNYSQNPSVETDASLWTSGWAINTGTSPAAYLTLSRVTGELAAHPDALASSIRLRLLAPGTAVASSDSQIYVQQVVDLPSLSPAERVSFTIWAAALELAGTSVTSIKQVQVTATWRHGTTSLSSATVATTSALGDLNGRVYSALSLLPPATTDNVIVRVTARVTWQGSTTPTLNSEIRLYADALAVTVP